MAGHRALDAYVSHGVRDATWVRVLAGQLFRANLEAFLDPWDPDGSDVLPLRVTQGGRRARRTVLVFGPGAMATPWVSDRFEAILAAPPALERLPVIVLRYGDADLPGYATGHPVVDFGDVDPAYEPRVYQQRVAELVRLIGPIPGADPPELPRTGVPFRAARLHVAADRVSCALVHTTPTPEASGDVIGASAAVTVDGHRFNALLWIQQRHDPEALRAIGTALGATFTPDPVGRMLEDAADEAYALGTTLSVGIATRGELGELPWETLILPGHNEPLALHAATRVYRTPDVAPAVGSDPPSVPGPLRILIVIAGPDGGCLVDYEREVTALMDAVEPARKYHGARVTLLNEATLPAIREALAREPFHVLHISSQAHPDALLLEDAYGQASEVTPDALCAAMPPERRVPLIVLSGCWTAPSAGTEPPSTLAWSLLAAGVPQVIAMTAPVTDRYAIPLFADFYRELALADEPDVLTALAHARRAAEARRLADAAVTGRAAPAEWATPALYLRARPAPLYDPATPRPPSLPPQPSPPQPLPQPPSGRDLPASRPPTEFVGRRDELRHLLTGLRQPGSPGVLLHGIGGVGKSALAAEAVRRLGPDAGAVVLTTGAVSREMLRNITSSDRAGAALLVIDGMEANLVSSGDAWVLADPAVAAFLSDWVSEPDRRLLLASRHPFGLPAGRRLSNQHIGPLSWSEARKLIWRLRALDTLSLNDQHKSYVDSGGHPRTLLILDALLRRPGAAFAELRQRMERMLRDRKIDRPELWMAQVGKHGMDASLAEAVTLAVYRGLLGDLLSVLDDPVRAMLLEVAAHSGPIPRATLLALSPTDAPGTLTLLERSTLLTRLDTHDGVSFVVDADITDLLAARSTRPTQGLTPTS